ncbi:hypothetical protein GVX81_09160 [[Haemophilus] felis]|uniref:Uncharacterized protein n=1 Tax=[Haemophilus] felis TaxID=123822 RepID=A0A1T0AWD0_9PAST|nr:hypothetical protein [[Haemophilus] felis]NBI41653.1 hypothetical protein [[Haemophilus] felis]OOS01659.1 hypothetical protein B0188_09570 [[Haemophilus] felis]
MIILRFILWALNKHFIFLMQITLILTIAFILQWFFWGVVLQLMSNQNVNWLLLKGYLGGIIGCIIGGGGIAIFIELITLIYYKTKK